VLTQAGRAAKVRTLIVHAMGKNWRGPGDDLNWDNAMARGLLREFAGMSEEELAAV
jgi:hypothetical protein